MLKVFHFTAKNKAGKEIVGSRVLTRKIARNMLRTKLGTNNIRRAFHESINPETQSNRRKRKRSSIIRKLIKKLTRR